MVDNRAFDYYMKCFFTLTHSLDLLMRDKRGVPLSLSSSILQETIDDRPHMRNLLSSKRERIAEVVKLLTNNLNRSYSDEKAKEDEPEMQLYKAIEMMDQVLCILKSSLVLVDRNIPEIDNIDVKKLHEERYNMIKKEIFELVKDIDTRNVCTGSCSRW